MNRERAKTLFNKPALPLVVAWIARRENRPFYQSEATAALSKEGPLGRLGEAPAGVVRELSRLVDLGLLLKESIGNKAWYTVLEDPLWEVLLRAAGVLGLPVPDAEDEWTRGESNP